MPDKIDALYDALKADGAVTKSREHFREYISDDNNRRKLYEALKADGAIQSSNLTEFDNRLGYGSAKVSPSTVTAPTTAYRAKAAPPQVKAPAKAPKKQSGGSRLSRATANAKAGAAPRYDVFGWAKGTMAKIKQAKREKREGSFLGRILNKAEDATKEARRQKATQAQVKAKPKQVTAEQATADLWNTVAQGNAMMGGLHDRAEAIKEYQRQGWRDKSGRVATVGGVHSDVRKGKSRFNPETGKMEERWLTATGGEFGSAREGDLNQLWQEHPEILEKDMARRSLNEEGLAGDINRALNARYEELAEIDRRRQEGRSFGQQMIHGLANAEAGPSGGYNSEYLNDLSADPATRQLRAAKALMDDAKDIVNEADTAAKEGKYAQWLDSWSFLKGAGRGFVDKVGKVSTWDFGISDVLNGLEVKSALDKFDKGKELSKEENMLLEALATKAAVDGYFGSELGRGYKAGGVTAESLPFMLEMAANPLSKAGGAAAKAFSKWVAKKYGVKMGSKLLGQTMKVAGRGGAKATEKAVTKGTRALLRSGEFAVTQGGNVLGATGMALTSGQGRVRADMLRRQQGEVAPVLNQETGNFEIGGREYGEDGMTAYLDALVNTGIENYTEMMGVGVGKGFGKVRAKLFNKMGLSKVNGWIDKIGSSGLARGLDDFLTKTQWHGPIGEYFEEVAGNVLNAALVHDMEFSTAKDKGVFNLDDNIDTFLGVALMGGVFSTIKTLGYVPSRRAAKRRLDFADRMCQQQMGTDWGAISASLTGTDEQIQQVLSDVMKSTDYNQQQKQAVLNYAYALQNAKGVEVGAEKLRAEMTPEQVSEQDAEEQGYNTEDDAEMRTNKLRYDNAVEQLQQSGLDMSEVEAMAADGSIYRVLGTNTFDEAETNAVKEWLMARASYNGMISRVQDDIDDEVATAQQAIEARVAKQDQGGDGMIHPAVLKLGDRQVDIVGGNVVIHEEDGSIDANKSDKDLLVRDTQTGKVEMVNINDLARAEAPIDAQQLFAETRANIENARANEVGDKIDGTVQVGGTYIITDAEQKQHTLTVLDDNGDGNLVVQEEGGEPFAMNRDQLQTLVDTTAKQALAAQQADEGQAGNAQLTMHNAQSDGDNAEFTMHNSQLDGDNAQLDGASEEIVSDLNAPMPMKEVDGKQRVDYNRATPERAAHHIYNEKGYSEEEADEMVANTIAAKQKALEEKAKALDEANAEVTALEGVRPTTPLTEETEDEYNAEKAEIEQRRSEAQARAQQANQELEQALQEVTHWEAIRDAASQLGENAQSMVNAQFTMHNAQSDGDNAQFTMHNAQLEQPVEETPVASEEQSPRSATAETSEEAPTQQSEQPAASEETPKEESETEAATRRNRERIEKVRAQIKAKVEKLAEACAIPSHVIESEADLDKYPKRISNAVRAQLKQGKRVRGFYDPKSGHMYYYMPGLLSEKDADETFAHEAVAHGGLRLLLNDQAAFDELCDNVWDLMSVEDKARYMDYVGVRSLEDMTQENKRAAADEYMAHLSDGQQQNSTSTVKKVLRAISEMIQKVFKKRGINLDIKSDEDIMALLKASRRNLSEVDKEAIKEEIGDALESEDGSDSDRVLMSTVSIFDGAGFEAEQIDENGNSVPMTDAEGNMVVKMGSKEFSAKNPIKASDLNVKAGKETSVLQMLVNDAKEVNNLSEKRAKKIYQNYADILNMYLRMGSAEMGGPDAVERNWQWLGETVYRTIAANGDAQYSYSMDIIKVCKKNEAVIKAMSAHQLLSGRGATPSEIVEIYRKTYSEGYQVPCPVCYVFTRYIRNGKYASAAIRGMETYGEHLPGGSDVWTVKQWLDELDRLNRLTNSKYEPKGKETDEQKEARVKEAKRYEKALADANEITVEYEKRINALSYELTSGVSKEREKEIMDEIKVMDARYQGAIDVISFQALTNWIKTFAIEEKSKKWRMREDAKKPEDMNDFRANALDLRLTANTMVNYPAIQRLRKSGCSAAGKEITFASNNELGEVVSGLGINKTNLGLYANPYQQFLAATDPKEKAKLRKKAQERFKDASVYAAMQTLRGGQRMWSWSDNIERLGPDVAINLMQLELLDGAMQTYSKQLEGVKLTAQMGAYVNGSLMAKDNGWLEVSKDEVYKRDGQLWLKEDKKETVEEPQVGGEVVPRERVYVGKDSHVYQAQDGKLYVLQYDDVIGIDPFGNRTIKDKDGNDKKAKGLFELNDELDKAGNILVGMNDLHIRAALADPRVFFVIPWHSSGANNHILAEMFAILGQRIDSSVDYQSMQEEKNMGSRDKDSKKLPAVTQRLRDLWNEGKQWAEENGWASGMDVDSDGDLLTEDQYMYRQLRSLIFNGNIFEEMPSEEKYNEAVETYEKLDEDITAWENQKEGADAETKKWLDKQIEKARPKRNTAQHIIELHDGLIDWRDSDVNKNDEHWQRHHPKRINVEEARAMVLEDEFLKQVYGRVEPIGHMTNGDNTYIYPYEYWDESSTYDTADVNGKRYVEYCRRMGYKPKFSGDWKTKDESKQDVGNFVHDPGYWKLLIDRRMYDRAGKYQWLDPVSSEDFNTGLINPEETQHEFQVLDDFEDAMAGDVRFSTVAAPVFYSNAEKAVEGIKQNKATAEQWKAMLTKAGGIKAGEDKWMGLSEWLDENKGKSLTKDEVLQFVRDNGIQMEEVNYGDMESTPLFQELNKEYLDIAENPQKVFEKHAKNFADFHNEMEKKYGEDFQLSELTPQERNKYTVLLRKQEESDPEINDPYDIAFREMGDRHGGDFEAGFAGGENGLEVFDSEIAGAYLGTGNLINATRIEYSTDGLDNKREIAFVVPTVEQYQEGDEIHFGPENQGKAIMWVRFGEATDADGKRVLVIDEIQSNRHQDAREKGYISNELSKKLEETEAKISQTENELRELTKAFDTKYGGAKEWHKTIEVKEAWGRNYKLVADEGKLTKEEYSKLNELQEERDSLITQKRQLQEQKAKQDGVPAAPFEKNWHEVAMKRMLRLAAEEGFDKVAWTTGEQQAERYGIGGVVESITKGKTRGENTLVSVQYKNGKHDSWVVAPGGKVVDGGITTGENLSDLIGKELSEKVMSLDENGSITGDGLRIGGEGMKGFYDQMLPRFMDKYGKKWGVKTGTVELPNVEEAGRTMHAVDVTPEMKESVMQGQLLFSTVSDEAIARDAYERMMSNGRNQFQEAVQDSMLSLKRLYQAILGKGTHIEDVASHKNAYMAENLMSSVNAAEQHEYYIRFMKPLLAEVAKIAGKDKKTRQELTDYLLAKHGLERNKVLADRDAQEAAAAGANYQDAYDANRERDYAGLTALTEESDVHSAEAAAQQMVDEYEAAHDTTELWAAIKNATAATLEKLRSSGVLSNERFAQISGMFENYIPLQGWEETTSDQVYGYLTSKNGPFTGSPIKRAKGRSSKADDPIATLAKMADDAIRQGNRNLMKQRFYNFVMAHPSDLVSVSDLWLKYNDVIDEWEPVFTDINDNDSGEEISRKLTEFNSRMEQLAQNDPAHYKHGSDTVNIPYKVIPGNEREHQVLVKINGQTYVLTINGNPRAAQALNGLTNPDVEQGDVVGNMLKAGEWINRQLSGLYTTKNPEFTLSNFLRDTLYSNCMTWVREGRNYALKFHKNFARCNPFVMGRLLKKWENNALDDSKPLERLFGQFMRHGGETGYTNVRDVEDFKKSILDELKRSGKDANSRTRAVWHAIVEWFDLLNRSVENCARFAAFVTSREMGRSAERSAYDAKEISVNFNKKGSGGKMLGTKGQDRNILKLLFNPKSYLRAEDRAEMLGQLGSYIGGGGRLLYVFWNAGVQGTTNFARGVKRHPVKATAGAAGMFMLGTVMPIIAKAFTSGDDDDENAYYNLPEYIRRSNICLPGPGDAWITIPLPIEFRAFYGLGELATGVIGGGERYSNSELAFQLASQVSQMLPLDMLEGGGGFHAFIPTLLKPLVEAQQNKSWTGLPIYRSSEWNKNDPEWTKAYQSTSKVLVSASEWLNELTGGDSYQKGWIDINPSKVEYMLKGYFGGAFTTIDRLVKMGTTITGDRDFEWRNMLMASRVMKSGDERTANRKLTNEYFKYMEEYEETKRLLNNYQKEADAGALKYAEKLDFLHNSPEYARYQIFDAYKGMFDGIREAKKDATGDMLKELEAEENAMRREMVDMMHSSEDKKSYDLDATAEQRLAKEQQSSNKTVSDKASKEIAKRYGGKDGFVSSDAAYNQTYVNLRDWQDIAEDALLQSAKKEAKESGDKARYKQLDSAQTTITNIRKGLGHGNDEQVMERLREVRSALLTRNGITR